MDTEKISAQLKYYYLNKETKLKKANLNNYKKRYYLNDNESEILLKCEEIIKLSKDSIGIPDVLINTNIKNIEKYLKKKNKKNI